MTDLDFNTELATAGELLTEIGAALENPEDLDLADLMKIFSNLDKITKSVGLVVSVATLIDSQGKII